MDTPCPRREDDLSDMERRLSGWQPATDNLHPDAMLFAAGRAAERRSRAALLWPAACVLLAVQGVGLGVWGLREHAECQALASRLHQRDQEAASLAAAAAAEARDVPYEPAPGDYLSLRHALERDAGGWLTAPASVGPLVYAPPPARPVILTPRSREGLVDP